MTKHTSLKQQSPLSALLFALIFMLSGCTQLQLHKTTNDKPSQVVNKKETSVLDYISDISGSSSKTATSVPFDQATLIDIVKQAKKSRSPKREALLIKATHTALSQDPLNPIERQWQDQVQLAAKIYALIDTDQLTQGDLDYYYELIGLELAVAQNDVAASQAKLSALDAISNSRKIPLATKHYLTDSRIRASALSMQGDHMAAARLLIFRVEGLNFSKKHRQMVHDLTWHYLSLHRQTSQDTSTSAISITTAQAPSEEWQAWLELNDIFELSDQSQLGLMHGKVKSWSLDWSNTQVGALPPFEVNDFMLADFKAAKHIAVFLPTSGQLQHAGKAIIDGLMASYYREQSQTSAQLKITIYDTAQADSMAELYAQAKNNGAEFIIGPLQKEDVQSLKLHTANITNPEDRLPVLALNYTDNDALSNSRYFFEFGLSAEDEAIAVADYAISNGLERVLILRPNSPWGERISTAFKQRFDDLNGQVLDETAFSEPPQFSKEVQNLLGLQISKSRHKEMERELGRKLDYTPRRRQDVDFIFLLANPNEARQLKPTINYHYGQTIPVIATSHIYAGSHNPNFDKDLNNIKFVDIPWVLTKDIEFKKTFEEQIPNAQTQFQRLHALGIDAFSLMREFPMLKHVSSSELEGATGVLTIKANGKVKRELSWAQFKRGQVKVIEE